MSTAKKGDIMFQAAIAQLHKQHSCAKKKSTLIAAINKNFIYNTRGPAETANRDGTAFAHSGREPGGPRFAVGDEGRIRKCTLSDLGVPLCPAPCIVYGSFLYIYFFSIFVPSLVVLITCCAKYEFIKVADARLWMGGHGKHVMSTDIVSPKKEQHARRHPKNDELKLYHK